MNAARACSHCELPVGRLGQQRDVNGEAHWFCCYGCCLAYQVRHGTRDEPEAAAWLVRLGVGGFLAMNIMLFSLLVYSGALAGADAWLMGIVPWLLWILATPLMAVLGGPFIAGAWRAARERRLTADTLVSLGALAAYLYSAWQVLRGSGLVYFDTATMVLVFFTLGRYLEAQGRVRAARSLAPMLAAERAEARMVSADEDTMRPVRLVKPGDIVRVLPGERIAVDGIVVEGRSECDEAILTGQPQRQPKAPGAPVHAGSVNGSGQLLVRATVMGTDTRWVGISRFVREALAQKSLLGETIDRFAARFIPWVLVLAGATVWYWTSRGAFDAALLAGLAVLVVACPCSLGLAAPLATALGIGKAAQRGILIRGGGAMEKLARVKGIAFDKTGTLTQGRLQLASIAVDAANEDEVLRRARLLAIGSEHPIARALLASDRGVSASPAQEIQAVPGAGVTGRIDGSPCAMGSAAFVGRLGWRIAPALAAAPLRPGHTAVYVAWGGEARGLLTLADATRPEASSVIAALEKRGMTTRLLSGDGDETAALLAQELGIPTWHAALLPEDKVRILREWMTHDGPVAMVGDGLNDGPVLAAASVGIAVGGATDLAKESADIILPAAGLASLPWLLQLAGDVRRSIRANLAWAFAYNSVALTLAACGVLQPAIAAALMAGSSVLVVLRSLRASRKAQEDEARQNPSRDLMTTDLYGLEG